MEKIHKNYEPKNKEESLDAAAMMSFETLPACRPVMLGQIRETSDSAVIVGYDTDVGKDLAALFAINRHN